MALFAAIMLWARSQSKDGRNSWAPAVATISGFLGLATAIAQVVLLLNAPEDDGGIAERQQSYAAAAMRVLGEEIGSHHKGTKILIITPPETEWNKPYHDLVIAGLTEGISGRCEIGQRVELGGDAEYGHAVEFGAANIDMIIENRGDHNLIVSLLGLPHNYTEMEFWNFEDEERPVLVLADASVYELRRAISADYISAVLVHNPDYSYSPNDRVPNDYREAFAKRYLLVTPRTVDDIATERPALFKPEEE
jgi:hypothetical protein